MSTQAVSQEYPPSDDSFQSLSFITGNEDEDPTESPPFIRQSTRARKLSSELASRARREIEKEARREAKKEANQGKKPRIQMFKLKQTSQVWDEILVDDVMGEGWGDDDSDVRPPCYLASHWHLNLLNEQEEE